MNLFDIISILRKNGFQLLAVFLATLIEIPDGMQYGWSSPMIPRYQTADAPFLIDEQHVSWVESSYTLSGLLGLPITIYLVDKIGRKQTTLVASFFCGIAWFFVGIADDITYIYIARIMTGMCSDIAFVSMPMYVAEIAHPDIRGFLTGLIHIIMYVGTILIYSIGPIVPLYVPPIIGGGFLILQICTYSFMPESPYFLLDKGRKIEAQAALKKLRNTSNESIDHELKKMELSIERQRLEIGKISDLWLVRSNRKATIIVTLLNLSTNMTGLTPIVMNVQTILAQSKSGYLSAEIFAIIFACLLLVGTILGMSLVDKFGRRILLISSAIACSILLLTSGLYFHLQSLSVNVSNFSLLPTICIMLFAVSFKAGLGIVPIVMSSEVYPSKLKAFGMGYADAVFLIFSALFTILFNQINENFGMHFPFYMFSICTLVAGVGTTLFIPETKGKTLEEIQMILKE